MRETDRLVTERRAKLEDASIPAGSEKKWGIALYGGGIRSATFCFGLLRALASNKVLLRFDLMSTVSGGGYIASAIGSLFHRASDSEELRGIKKTIGEGNTSWFLWWLRANGRYWRVGYDARHRASRPYSALKVLTPDRVLTPCSTQVMPNAHKTFAQLGSGLAMNYCLPTQPVRGQHGKFAKG